MKQLKLTQKQWDRINEINKINPITETDKTNLRPHQRNTILTLPEILAAASHILVVNWKQRLLYIRDWDFDEEYDEPFTDLVLHEQEKEFVGVGASLAEVIYETGERKHVKIRNTFYHLNHTHYYEVCITSKYVMYCFPLDEDNIEPEIDGVIEANDFGIAYILRYD